ncbi:uncharacterized protein [Primulina eburnea]
MSDGEADWDSCAPEELTSQQGTQQYEEMRKIQRENKARVFREGKERRKKLMQKLTSKHLQKGQVTSDKAIIETHEKSHDNKGMLLDDIVKLLAAREKIVFTSDSEDDKSEKKAASRKRSQKKLG